MALLTSRALPTPIICQMSGPASANLILPYNPPLTASPSLNKMPLYLFTNYLGGEMTGIADIRPRTCR